MIDGARPVIQRGCDCQRLRPTVRVLGAAGKEESLIADIRRCTQIAQMVRYGSNAPRHAFDVQAWLAEIEHRAQPQAGRFEIVGTLHPMQGIQCRPGYQFDQKCVFDQQVRDIFLTATPL